MKLTGSSCVAFQIKGQRHDTLNEDVDDAIGNYDYDNVNDRNDFCPSLEQEVREVCRTNGCCCARASLSDAPTGASS